MELRSRFSRSRSMTPFTQLESFDKEIMERGNHVEKTVTRSSKRTTITTIRSNENATSSTDEVTSFTAATKPTRRSARSEKSIKNLYKTSDYSSEDGENEVSSTRTISQNEKNQLIEDARAAANGGAGVSALELYKKSGRYWDVYPKTDWTYSLHSKDRVELAPGVVAMPNMSRKTIHSVHDVDSGSYSNYLNKETNTESYLSKSNSYSTGATPYEEIRPRKLFNNNYDDTYEVYEKHSTYRYSYWTRFRRTVTTVFTSVLTIFYYAFAVQTWWLSKLHNLTSRVMLLDTWLLWKSHAGNKTAKLVALCLVPLLLLGGWWLLSNVGGILYAAYFNSTSVDDAALKVPLGFQYDKINTPSIQEDAITTVKTSETSRVLPVVEEKIIKVTEKIYMEPPTAGEIAAGLTNEQLEYISNYLKHSVDVNTKINTDEVVESIIQTPSFQNIFNTYDKIETRPDNFDLINNQQNIINNLREEVEMIKNGIKDAEKMRQEELYKIVSELKAETIKNNAQLTFQLNRCCRKPIIDIDSSVRRILGGLLNDAEFLKQQNGFNEYLHNIFLAKQDLEAHLLLLTSNLDSKYDNLIAENSRVIMDEVANKIKLDMYNKVENVKIEKREVQMGSLSDEQVKRIVRNALAIYDADKTGLVDYAMETMGGQILTTRCTENYHYGKAVVSVLGIPLWYPSNTPRTIITPSINPGECWAFQNFPGFVVIQLSNMVEIEAFSMEHISRLLVPNGKIDSAPKEFEVYGLTEENDKEPVKLGDYVYDYDGESLQFFEVQNRGHSFAIIELRIISNHGNPNYTCLYRFRVHGKLSHDES